MEGSKPARATSPDTEDRPQTLNSRWRCPDCDAYLEAANDTDLQFVKREHIREYHPNRSIG